MDNRKGNEDAPIIGVFWLVGIVVIGVVGYIIVKQG